MDQIDNDTHDVNQSTVETSTKSQVPLLLIKAFKTIEERAYASFEDLYDVYRLSSDTNKIDEVIESLNLAHKSNMIKLYLRLHHVSYKNRGFRIWVLGGRDSLLLY